MAGRDRNKALKDKVQANKNMIVYIIMVLAAVGTIVGWGLLPDMVSMDPSMEDAYFQPKGRLLLIHLAMTGLFSGLLWKWPRELAYLTGAILSLLLIFVLLYSNMGV